MLTFVSSDYLSLMESKKALAECSQGVLSRYLYLFVWTQSDSRLVRD